MNDGSQTRSIAVLGATGSIGQSTLDVVARHPDTYRVHTLTAHRNVDQLAALCRTHHPQLAVVADAQAAAQLDSAWPNRRGAQIRHGPQALIDAAAQPEVDTVMAAIVGAAGLPSAIEAARCGKRILLANKEALVVAGRVFMDAVEQGGATLLPIDSEHNALLQCMPGDARIGHAPAGVRRLLLTASGGPFRDRDPASLATVTPGEACAHPNWSMGPKISVDSATMMNKGLELIEACWLFGLPAAQVEIVIHRESVIHSLVEYVDGSVLAQLGNPDMRTPIAYGLAWPERIDAGVSPLDLVAQGQLRFEAPDTTRFPALALAMQAATEGGSAPIVLNAANEVAVQAFLDGVIGYLEIADTIRSVLDAPRDEDVSTLEAVLEQDRRARRAAQAVLGSRATDFPRVEAEI